LTLLTSAVVRLSATVPADEQSQAKVLIFNFKNNIQQQFRAGRYKFPHLQQYLFVA
jgi:hypothetical protein